ncbi:MAG: hypothetical protein ABIR11_12000 [Candidatus Limnocylindrales bacterium]
MSGSLAVSGCNQRFIGEISADAQTIEGRWERGWAPQMISGIGFPLTCVRG